MRERKRYGKSYILGEREREREEDRERKRDKRWYTCLNGREKERDIERERKREILKERERERY